MRFNQGKGPIKIAADLKQRGIDNFDLSAYDFFAFFSAFLSKTGVLTWLVCILPRAQHES
jgi:hypothetical protein